MKKGATDLKQKTERMGQIFKNKRGVEAEIIEYNNSMDITPLAYEVKPFPYEKEAS